MTIATAGHTGMTIRSGTANRGNIYFSDGTSGDAEYRGYIEYNHDGDKLSFGTANSTRLHINSSGNVGVGTTSPNAPLAVLATSSTYKGMELITPAGDGSGEFIFGVHQSGSSAGRNIVFIRGGTDGTASESMRLDSSGYLGLGTSSPQRMLHIAGGAQTGLKISGNNTGSTSSDGFDIYVRDDNNGVELNQREASHIALLTSGSERMRIDSAGKLFTNRTVSSTSGGHPALQINTISTGTASNAFATGIDFQTEGTSRNRLSVTTDKNWIFYKDSGLSLIHI